MIDDALCAMWCSRGMWIATPEPKAMHPDFEKWMREQERCNPGCLERFCNDASR